MTIIEILTGLLIFVVGCHLLYNYLNNINIKESTLHLLFTVSVCIAGLLLATHQIFHHSILH